MEASISQYFYRMIVYKTVDHMNLVAGMVFAKRSGRLLETRE